MDKINITVTYISSQAQNRSVIINGRVFTRNVPQTFAIDKGELSTFEKARDNHVIILVIHESPIEPKFVPVEEIPVEKTAVQDSVKEEVIVEETPVEETVAEETIPVEETVEEETVVEEETSVEEEKTKTSRRKSSKKKAE